MAKQIGYFTGALLAGAVFFIAATPWLYGKRFEQHYTQSIENLHQAKGITIIASDIERGWFSSEAMLNMEVSSPSLPAPLVLLTHLNISHGPFVKAPAHGWHTAGALVELDSLSINGHKTTADVFALAKSSHIDWSIQVPAIRESDFEISKSSIEMMSENDFSKVKITFDVPQSSWSDKKNHLTLQGLQMDVHLPLDEPDWDYLADVTARVEHLSVNGDALALENFVLEIINRPQAKTDFIESDLLMAFSSLLANDEASGPMNLQLKTRNIPIAFLRAFEEQASRYQDPEQLAALFATPNDMFKKLLAASPQIKVPTFEYKIPEGTIKASLNMVLGGERVKPDGMGVVDTLNLDAQIVAPRQLIYQIIKNQETGRLIAAVQQQELTLTPEQFDMEVEKATTASLYQMEFNKMMVRDGDNDYRFTLSVLNGVVSLNGTPSFSLPSN